MFRSRGLQWETSYHQRLSLARLEKAKPLHQLSGYGTGQRLQFTLGTDSSGTNHEPAIPYSLAHVQGNCWLVGDECGRVWIEEGRKEDEIEGFNELLTLNNGIADICVLRSDRILMGDMRGRVSQFDLNHVATEIPAIRGLDHDAPIKCIRWQPNSDFVFATASQNGDCHFADLRCSSPLIGTLRFAHGNLALSSRATMTGIVFHPLVSERFFTSGTPGPDIKEWDWRMLPSYTRAAKFKRLANLAKGLEPVDTFFVPEVNGRRARSSVALTIDSCGSRIFLNTSNDCIFEFLTCNYASPVAFYSSENFKSCSFFSNIALDPTDKFLLAGSADGNGYVWDTSWSASAAFKVPIQSQLEVSKVVWKGSTIASISDDLTVSFFKQQMPDCSRSIELVNGARTGCYSVVDSFADIDSSCLLQAVKSNPLAKRQADLSLPVTPIKRSHSSQTPSSSLASPVVNKSILEFFPKSPRPQ